MATRRLFSFAAFLVCLSLLMVSCGGGNNETVTSSTATRQLGVAGGQTGATGVAVDSDGNVYVTGYTTGGLDGNTLKGTQDLFLVKYSPAGNRFFTKQLGIAGGQTGATGVAVDSDGSVYVTGYTTGGLDGNTLTGTQDLFLTKYSSAGNIFFTKQLGVAGGQTGATSVAVDSDGNVYITGYTTGGLDGNTLSGTQDLFLTKYSAAGNRFFTRQLGVEGAETGATGIAINSDGNVYVTGYTAGGLNDNTLSGTLDLFLTKYSSAGNWFFTKQLGVEGAKTGATGVTIDSDGNVYIAGYTTGGLDGNTLTGTQDLFLTKYSSVGDGFFTSQLGVEGAETGATGIIIDSDGNVYITGYTTGGLDGNTLTGTQDLFLAKYTLAGNKQ